MKRAHLFGVVAAMIQQWADEAEDGYDVDELKQRGRGRPGRGAEPRQVVAVRLTAEELAALDAAAAKNEMSRSEAIHAALAHLGAEQWRLLLLGGPFLAAAFARSVGPHSRLAS